MKLDEYGLPEYEDGGPCGPYIEVLISDWQEMMQGRLPWRPIETAPKDGTDILAYIPKSMEPIEIISWRKPHAEWISARCVDGLCAGEPTHWMPLPRPPVTE